jgi:hypothetical protein
MKRVKDGGVIVGVMPNGDLVMEVGREDGFPQRIVLKVSPPPRGEELLGALRKCKRGSENG